MNFKLWLEKLEPISKEPIPEDYWTKNGGVYARIYQNQHLNPQWLQSFRKDKETITYTMPIQDDKFIHFAPKEIIQQIYNSNILGKSGAYAVSTTFGKWFPQVQYTHISRMLPNSLYITDIEKKIKKPNKRTPDFGKEIDAIIFQTNEPPQSATAEEVWWDKSIKIYNTQILSSRDAINILKHTPEKLDYPHIVRYK